MTKLWPWIESWKPHKCYLLCSLLRVELYKAKGDPQWYHNLFFYMSEEDLSVSKSGVKQ